MSNYFWFLSQTIFSPLSVRSGSTCCISEVSGAITSARPPVATHMALPSVPNAPVNLPSGQIIGNFPRRPGPAPLDFLVHFRAGDFLECSNGVKHAGLERGALKEHHALMYMSGPSQRMVCEPIERHFPEPPQQGREPEPPAEPVREPAATVAPPSR